MRSCPITSTPRNGTVSGMSSVCRKTDWSLAAKTHRDQIFFCWSSIRSGGSPISRPYRGVGRGENCLPFFGIHCISTRSYSGGPHDGGYKNPLHQCIVGSGETGSAGCSTPIGNHWRSLICSPFAFSSIAKSRNSCPASVAAGDGNHSDSTICAFDSSPV